MINRCFNPACNRELRYLRDGRVVRVIRGDDENACMEHYWLCGACYQRYDFVFPSDGTVTLGDKMHREHANEFQMPEVVLPERRSEKRTSGDIRKLPQSVTVA